MKIKSFFKFLGPGLITGASDDDPSGIATYSQAGAQFGFGTLWLVLFQLPMMIVIQEICARIGLVTGNGLAGIIRNRYSKKIGYPIISLLLIANTINIGADIGAMAASVKLVLPQIPIVLVTSFIYCTNCLHGNFCSLQEICDHTQVSHSELICIHHYCIYCWRKFDSDVNCKCDTSH